MSLSVRAYLHKTKEYLYPDSTDPKDLSVFYGTLEGYKLKNKEFDIELGSGVEDINENEIYVGDKLIVKYYDPKLLAGGGPDFDEGYVDFIDGVFVVTNEFEMFWRLDSFRDYKLTFEIVNPSKNDNREKANKDTGNNQEHNK